METMYMGMRILFIVVICAAVSVLTPFRLKYLSVRISLIIVPSNKRPMLISSRILPILYSSIVLYFKIKPGGKEESLRAGSIINVNGSEPLRYLRRKGR